MGNHKLRPLKARNRSSLPKDPFSYIGLWQFLTFIILLLLVWFNELRDGPAFFFGARPETPNYLRGSIMSAAVLLTAIITIGNTYLQQKRVINNLLSVCSNCHKIRVNQATWQRMEDYLSETSLLSFTHGLCPQCQADLMKTINKNIDARQDKE